MESEPLTIDRFEATDQSQGVLRLKGPLTASTSFYFESTVRGENHATMILDMNHVPYMDSVGLGSLVGIYVSSQKSGRRVALSGVNPRVLQLFQITKLDSVLLVFPNLMEAITALAMAGNA